MPQIESAKKALRQNIKRRQRNIVRHQAMKDVIKEYKKLVAGGKKAEAEKSLSKVFQNLDKMAKVKFIKKNKASRLKSRLAKKLA
ncbi:MAG: 30S ribosomal protein S20 [bacterium]|nr:30S ribosomal protein S20 [bacterium]